MKAAELFLFPSLSSQQHLLLISFYLPSSLIKALIPRSLPDAVFQLRVYRRAQLPEYALRRCLPQLLSQKWTVTRILPNYSGSAH